MKIPSNLQRSLRSVLLYVILPKPQRDRVTSIAGKEAGSTLDILERSLRSYDLLKRHTTPHMDDPR